MGRVRLLVPGVGRYVIGSVVANPAEPTLKGRALERLGWQHTVG